MPAPVDAVAFDVNETLFSLAPVGEVLERAGLPPTALPLWFARVLRDGFALAATGSYQPFRTLGGTLLRGVAREHGVERADELVEDAFAAFGRLPAHDDVRPAFERLRDAGVRIVTLTNGHAETTRNLLQRNGLDGLTEACFSVDEVRAWKPLRAPYEHVAGMLGVQPRRLAMIAVHSWDVHGAKEAGLVAGYGSRLEGEFVTGYTPADVEGQDLVAVVDALLALPG